MTSGNIPAEFPSDGDQLISAALTNYGIPITGSIAAGFVIGEGIFIIRVIGY
jgi:hypothetical protein